mmetsp:Transcript_42476/g.51532  ORF Transcript_42476/g.51532 Transcript_42476/m.51532 type:complete len:93 (-) Transcript_42476:360-638(-)|eukprot:CAMPEP_0197847980 /NCGR_PEP_ID=MMETSP1438-20131217/7683_1 /TAXON_ID=1461541 /ORGANISM="Pterosperma sp., Strain CCMP1384" /LENGTH=92 /DNA_ID=CAMNT_0043460077 /DNA_START=73 /DNA_END=351 /DNA_ORIENTATION=+
MPYETLPPFAIVVGAITATGLLHSLIDHVAYGRPKNYMSDKWDRRMDFRDEQLEAFQKNLEMLKANQGVSSNDEVTGVNPLFNYLKRGWTQA